MIRNLTPLVLILLIVLSTARLTFGNKKDNETLVEKVKLETIGKYVNVIYRSLTPGKVKISLLGGNWLLAYGTRKQPSFVQPFNLGNLPHGNYRFEIVTPTRKIEKIIHVSESGIIALEDEQ
ncbi:hypothetical protein FNH22_05045 [Fulvivirga sp. M361]|uniref:hypothetical protein n=1 Tax=Fulvivirga sp. M361 TaxID=2594266 RepID=UPI00117A1914|nr:hypothetical protein [Fulvivirga sp. M361]TRX61425.1 hypothetical protein FNH22_05045 [Fulvivirga sp. M361]